MPCRDYGYEEDGIARSQETQNKIDMLSRIACRALYLLESIDSKLESIDPKSVDKDVKLEISQVLRDPEVKHWWPEHKLADMMEQEKIRKKNEVAKLKKTALSKLSEEEKEALGLK